MTTRDLGQEGFIWFVGVVEDRDDPLKLGRLKVRIYNIHSPKQSRTSTDELSWATVMTTVNGANYNNIGQAPVGIQVGTTVVGFFMDGLDKNNPVIIGAIAGRQTESIHDVPTEAREINTISKTQLGPEPTPSYRAKYPYNKVLRTESGHVIEIDDTPNFERLHVYHKSGSYVEINEVGRIVAKTVDDNIEVVVKNKEVFVSGNINMKVNGSFTIDADGDVVINGKTVNINRGTQGAARVGDAVPDSEVDGTQGIGQGSGTVFIGD